MVITPGSEPGNLSSILSGTLGGMVVMKQRAFEEVQDSSSTLDTSIQA